MKISPISFTSINNNCGLCGPQDTPRLYRASVGEALPYDVFERSNRDESEIPMPTPEQIAQVSNALGRFAEGFSQYCEGGISAVEDPAVVDYIESVIAINNKNSEE